MYRKEICVLPCLLLMLLFLPCEGLARSTTATEGTRPALSAAATPETPALSTPGDTTDFLPPPPEPGSPAFAYDEAMYQQGLALRATLGAQAAEDAAENLSLLFNEAFGCAINKESTPAIFALLKSMRSKGSALSVRKAKNHYGRVRPYVYYNAGTCFPQQEAHLRGSGSYPSGHSTRGWAMALVLAEINPPRQGQILKRGYALGQNRVICGYHWQSDVDAGRLVGAAGVADLHADPAFRAQLQKAKEEFQRLVKEGAIK